MTAHLINHLFASSTPQLIAQRVSNSWPWYVIRGAGFVAAGLLILLMLSGIAQVTGFIYRFFEPITAWAIHRALAIALCVSLAVHVGFLLIDHYVRFSLVQVFVPLMSQYSNGTKLWGIALGSLAVSLGILAAYGVALVVASSLGWIDRKKSTWKRLHYVSYAVALCVFLHALYTGSDLKYGLFRETWIVLGLIVVLGVLSRLWRAGTTKPRESENHRISS